MIEEEEYMREIKFRAWHSKEKKMYGPFSLQRTLGVDSISDCHDEALDESPIWVQYTGLKDKNGKEIYEGDILKFDNDEESFIGSVGNLNSQNLVVQSRRVTNIKASGYFIRINSCHNREIIGNIYENPELLETK